MPTLVPSDGGRPFIEPTAEDVEFIERSAGEGCDMIEIARGLHIGKTTLSRWRKDHETVAEAIEIGRAIEHKALRSKLHEKAMAGDTVALLFLLKCRHGYREGDQSERGGGATITINLPGAMPLDKFLNVEHGPDSRAERLPNPTSISTGRG